MDIPPEPILTAALFTLHRALIHVRNCTLQHTPEAAKQANDFMEALHEIPDFLARWSKHDLAELRLHLADYPAKQWPGSPDLVRLFDSKLAELS